MGWLRKTWAALVALFLRSPKVESVPAEVAPAQPIDLCADLHMAPASDFRSDLSVSPGSPLKVLLDQMDKAFPAPNIKPGSDMASLQYAAGQRAVVEWVRMKQKRGQA